MKAVVKGVRALLYPPFWDSDMMNGIFLLRFLPFPLLPFLHLRLSRPLGALFLSSADR